MKLPRLLGRKAAQAKPAPAAPGTLGRTIIASVAMRLGNTVLKRGIDRGILGIPPETVKSAARSLGLGTGKGAPKAKAKTAKAESEAPSADAENTAMSVARTVATTVAKTGAMVALPGGKLGARLITIAATRLATRSVPGAIIVGGALLAKTLHERRKKRKDAEQP